jgi:hypothetical protein
MGMYIEIYIDTYTNRFIHVYTHEHTPTYIYIHASKYLIHIYTYIDIGEVYWRKGG